MDISVIIPTYNSADTIQACLDSVLSQSFTDYEIIIMDGMSEDNTLDIIRNYGDERIRVYSQKDKGVYDAMNKGIDAANGDWLYFLGSDDRLYDDMVFDNIVNYIERNVCDIVYGKAFFSKKNDFHKGLFEQEDLLLRLNVCHQAIFYKKFVFNRLGYYNLKFPINADWDFNIRCASTPDLKIDFIDLAIVIYNDYSGLSNSDFVDHDFRNIHARTYHMQLLQANIVIKEKIEENNKIYQSKEFVLGNLLIAPFRFIKRIISSYFIKE